MGSFFQSSEIQNTNIAKVPRYFVFETRAQKSKMNPVLLSKYSSVDQKFRTTVSIFDL